MPIASPRHSQTPALVALGGAIRKMRKRKELGISQEELAHRAGIDRSYMSSIERGEQNPGVMAIVAICGALEVSMAELMESAGL